MAIATETQELWFRSYVQSLMTELLDEPVEADADGDFPICTETSRGWVRPETVTPWGVQIFVHAAHGVPMKAATLREINEVNAAERMVKVELLDSGVVLVRLHLLAEAVTAANLGGALGKVLSVADRVGPLLTTVYGGQTAIEQASMLSDLEG